VQEIWYVKMRDLKEKKPELSPQFKFDRKEQKIHKL
jgi:hypothetical protein